MAHHSTEGEAAVSPMTVVVAMVWTFAVGSVDVAVAVLVGQGPRKGTSSEFRAWERGGPSCVVY